MAMFDEEQGESESAESAEMMRLAEKWRQKVRDANQHWRRDFDRMERLRSESDGLKRGDDDKPGSRKRVSWAFATVEGLLPVVYARMPEVQVQSKESVSPNEYPYLTGFARTLEILLNELLDHARLKRMAKDAVRQCFIDGLAWAKVGWQQDIEHDPVILQRINDSKDDLLRVSAMLKELNDPMAGADLEVQREELNLLLQSLEAQKEVVLSSGLVVDLVYGNDVLIDPAVRYWHEWDRARWMAHRILMPLETAKGLFPDADFDFVNSTSTDSAPQRITNRASGVRQEWAGEQMVTVFEVWNRDTMTVYTLGESGGGFLRAPYQPDTVAECWFPFQPLALQSAASRFYPSSVVERVLPLDDEYNRTRDKFDDHRSKAIPAKLFRRDALTAEDVQRIQSADVLEAIPLEGAPGGGSVEADIGLLRYPPIDQALYDTTSIRYDIEVMSGLQDAQRGAITKAKTAAEAEIMQSATSSRVSAMQDAVEDWIERIAEMAAEMALLVMSKLEVEESVGHGAVWPELDRKTIYQKVRVKIRAGTSGKPDRLGEQRNWAQVVPLAMQLMQSVTQAEMQGMLPIANAYRELLGETLRRLDERFEVDRLLPQVQQPQQPMGMGAPMPGAGAEMAGGQQMQPPMMNPNVMGMQ